MPITGECPDCGCTFKAPDKLLGREVKCPKCGIRIELTTAEEANAGPWYIQTPDGKQHGPADKEKLDALIASGRLTGLCRVRTEDSDEWQWAEELYPELASSDSSETDHEDLAPPEPAQPEPRVVRCPDCGKTVSTRADQCPHCGCPAAMLKQTPSLLDDSSPAPAPVDRQRSWVKPLVIGGIAAVVIFICGVGAVVWWVMAQMNQVAEQIPSLVPDLVIEQIELPEEPEAPTLEELRAYARDVAAAMAKKVDAYYRQAHIAQEFISSTKETNEMIQALAGGDLDAIPDSVPGAPLETITGSYESQYEVLFSECAKHLAENIRADEKDTSKILEIGEKWAADKQAAFDRQLGRQLGLE